MRRGEDQVVFDALLREQLSPFIAKVFESVTPGNPFLPNWHIDLMADRLEQCVRGDIRRLLITVPPRSLKSICTSVALPAWVLGRDPTRRIICASYAAELSTKLARDCRTVMDSLWYRQLFPGTQLQRSAELELETTRKGMRYATSVGGTLTGLGAGLIIIDDPLKPQDAYSKTKREGVKQWYDTTLYSRLDNKATDVIIVVMQRLHVDDLVAHVLEKEPWEHLDLPALADREQRFTLTTGREVGRAAEDALHEERESAAVLQTIRQNIGSLTFSAQYLQRPMPEEGNLVKWKWFPRYDQPPAFRAGKDRIIQSWDTASKVSELADYSVCTTWQQQGNISYLLEVYRAKLDFPSLKKAVLAQGLKWRARTILIEDSASGTALIQAIRDDRIEGFPRPIGVTAQGDKIMRVHAHTATLEAGHVFLPQKAPWLEAFQEEILAFPGSRHDDQVDSLSQFLTWREERRYRVAGCRSF
ncbi:phage terminase large subunit [Candidatus Nitrospira neomarina]|uniref:Phage terminase large subunit n=1 Tax=Candidatus Nitrospira neomarina TaxID=3020899 RepID=A0AA96GSA6_9BACT|nr:phage terminase large subunit [Candidatus Nitrospira neomarina]WNM63154.1 phage terminase large subunit [Candidatus Nitrospira neomarina]